MNFLLNYNVQTCYQMFVRGLTNYKKEIPELDQFPPQHERDFERERRHLRNQAHVFWDERKLWNRPYDNIWLCNCDYRVDCRSRKRSSNLDFSELISPRPSLDVHTFLSFCLSDFPGTQPIYFIPRWSTWHISKQHTSRPTLEIFEESDNASGLI